MNQDECFSVMRHALTYHIIVHVHVCGPDIAVHMPYQGAVYYTFYATDLKGEMRRDQIQQV